MPQDQNRQFLDFEQPIKDLLEEIELTKERQEKTKIDLSEQIVQLRNKVDETRKTITQNLTDWQRVQLSRHPDRPYTHKYIEKMTENYVELYGDRNVKDDKAMVGGFATLGGQTVMILGQQKDQYQKKAIAKFRDGQSRRLPEGATTDEVSRKVQQTHHHTD